MLNEHPLTFSGEGGLSFLNGATFPKGNGSSVMRICEMVRTGGAAKMSRRKGSGSTRSAGAPPPLETLSPQRFPSLQLQSGEHEPDRSSGTISTFWRVEATLEEISLELIVTNIPNGKV